MRLRISRRYWPRSGGPALTAATIAKCIASVTKIAEATMVDSTYKMAIPNIKAGLGWLWWDWWWWWWCQHGPYLLIYVSLVAWPFASSAQWALPIHAMPAPRPAIRQGIVPDLLMVVYSGEHYLRWSKISVPFSPSHFLRRCLGRCKNVLYARQNLFYKSYGYGLFPMKKGIPVKGHIWQFTGMPLVLEFVA